MILYHNKQTQCPHQIHSLYCLAPTYNAYDLRPRPSSIIPARLRPTIFNIQYPQARPPSTSALPFFPTSVRFLSYFWLALVCFYLSLVLVLVLVLYTSVTSHYLLSIYLFHALFAWLSCSFFGIALERMLLISFLSCLLELAAIHPYLFGSVLDSVRC